MPPHPISASSGCGPNARMSMAMRRILENALRPDNWVARGRALPEDTRRSRIRPTTARRFPMEDRPQDAPAPLPPSDDWPPPPPPPGEPPVPPPPAVIPWEQPGLPWTTGLVETVKLLLTKPRQAFERMPITGDPLRPLVFAILLGWLGAIFSAIWNLAFGGVMPAANTYGGYAMPHHFVLLT